MNLEKCNICPRNCKVDRLKGNIGYCRCNDKIKMKKMVYFYVRRKDVKKWQKKEGKRKRRENKRKGELL